MNILSKTVQDLASRMYVLVPTIWFCCTILDFMHCIFTQHNRSLHHFFSCERIFMYKEHGLIETVLLTFSISKLVLNWSIEIQFGADFMVSVHIVYFKPNPFDLYPCMYIRVLTLFFWRQFSFHAVPAAPNLNTIASVIISSASQLNNAYCYLNTAGWGLQCMWCNNNVFQFFRSTDSALLYVVPLWRGMLSKHK